MNILFSLISGLDWLRLIFERVVTDAWKVLFCRYIMPIHSFLVFIRAIIVEMEHKLLELLMIIYEFVVEFRCLYVVVGTFLLVQFKCLDSSSMVMK